MPRTIYFSDILEHSSQKNKSGASSTLIFPKELGIGSVKYVFFSDGAGVYQINIKVKEDFIIKNRFEEKMFAFSSFLKGDVLYENSDFGISKKLVTNQLNIFALNCENGSSFYKKGSHVKMVNIFTTIDFLKQKILENNSSSNLDLIINKLEIEPYFKLMSQSFYGYETSSKLHNIMSSNFDEKLQKLYVQSQTYELLFDWLRFPKSEKKEYLSENEKLYMTKAQKYILHITKSW